MNRIIKYLCLGMLLIVFGCKEEIFELGEAPTSSDATFTFAPSSQGENYVTFTNDNSKAFLKVWDFGNGTTSKQSTPTAYYPFAGEYTVKLTVYTSGGSASMTKVITIANTDPSICNQANLLNLTGGCNAINGKTWVIDKDRPGHFGVGPAAETSPIWYAASANEKQGGGMYDDEYTFFLDESKFIQKTNGDVYVNPANGSNFPGAVESPVGDLIAPYNAPTDLNYSLNVDQNGNLFLNLTNGGFIGYYTGVNTYQIISINENEMFIKFLDAANPALAWFHRLIRKGYVPDVEEPTTAALPINFETVAIPFSGFGGSNFEQVDNPDKTGINTSAKVGKTVKGGETWAGTVVTLENTIDFASKKTFHMKVWSPVTGVAKMKLEKAGDNTVFKEVDVNITKTNTWEELVFDFSGEPSGTYSIMAVFFDFGNAGNGNTFFFDDIIQMSATVASGLPVTFETSSQEFTSFGNASFSVIDNPDASGINTSAKVGEIVKTASSEKWAGVVTELPAALDFTTDNVIKVKVRSTVAGATVRLKIEKASDDKVFIEKDQTITNANTWEELTWDFSEAAKDTYSKIALFIDFDQQRAGNHQFDDMKQTSNASLFPVTFETASPAFTSFGNASFSVIDNPDASGINTSAKVGEIVKTASSEKWAGVVTEAPSMLDFTTKKTIKIKVRSSVAGATVRLKIEKASDNTVFIEKDQTITNANTWEELTWDFSEAAKDTYSKVALFIDFGQQRAGNHQFDDMKQE